MDVPLLDLRVIHEPIHKALMEALEKVVKSQHFILGDEVKRLEARLAAYTGARFAIGVSSGTDALLLALMAMDLKPGDEVITTPYSFFATAGAIARLGAKPVFVDILPDTYNLQAARVKAAITPRTKAIIPVHLYGLCADIAPLMEIAQRHHLTVIEDAAQAIGSATSTGVRAGAAGHIGCFSFFPSKNLGALGDGGLVTTQDEALYKRMVSLRTHGAEPKYYHKWVGGNFRLDAIQAAVLNVKIDHLDEWTEQRRRNAKRYQSLLSGIPFGPGDSLQLPQDPGGSAKYSHIYNQYVVRTPRRDALIQHLKKNHVGTEIYYPVPLHLQECFQYLGYKKGDFPESERASQETLAIPIFPGLTSQQQDYVAQTIRDFFKSPSR